MYNFFRSLLTTEVNTNKVTVSVNRKTVNEGIYKDDNTTFNIPVASTTKAGTMTAADKVKLDETLPHI